MSTGSPESDMATLQNGVPNVLMLQSTMSSIRTARLLLRPFAISDLDAFAALDADPKVREFFPSVLSRAESDASAARYMNHWERHGFGRWTIEVPGVTAFAGIVGPMYVPFSAAFTPAVEIGWRLAQAYWGQGYAIEAARAGCDFCFDTLRLSEIVAFTVPNNIRSRQVMERLGMTHSPEDDFDSPLVPEGHPLRRHVLYRLSAGVLKERNAHA
jgi:RimJ/RimL family protein N-acetyltransferase